MLLHPPDAEPTQIRVFVFKTEKNPLLIQEFYEFIKHQENILPDGRWAGEKRSDRLQEIYKQKKNKFPEVY